MSSTINIIIKEKASNTPNKPRPEYSINNILDKVQDYIKDINSGMEDSAHQWKYIKSLFLKLQGRKITRQFESDLLELIEPIILKYGADDRELAPKIEGHLLNRRLRD